MGHSSPLSDANGHNALQGRGWGWNKTKNKDGESCFRMFIHCLNGNAKYRTYKAQTKRGSLSVSQIDFFARWAFPTLFISVNVMYWIVYLYYSPE